MLLFTPSGVLSAGFYGPRGGDSTFFNFSATLTPTPAAGTVRLNSAIPASVTAVYISETNRDSVNVAAFLDQLITSGQFILVNDANRANYATYTLVSMVDNGSDRTFNVTYVESNGTLADNAKVWVSLIPPAASTTGSTTVVFGDGNDANLVCDGVNAVTGMTLVSANVYRLDRDIYANNLTVNPGVTVKPGNATAGTTPTWRIFCNGTLTNNGTIQNNGTDGTNAVVSTQGTLGGAAGGSGGSLGGAGNGASGRPGATTVGVVGFLGTGADPSQGAAGGSGGNSGAGVNASASGGAAGTVQYRRNFTLTPNLLALSSTGVLSKLLGGGGGGGGASGGGGGAAGQTGGASGGAGGGGGIVFIWARKLVNSGIISANGGNAGNASSGASTGLAVGGGGGSGGGGGGFVYLAYTSLTNSGTISASAGAKGLGSNGLNGGGAGADGVAGSAGDVLKFNTTSNSFE